MMSPPNAQFPDFLFKLFRNSEGLLGNCCRERNADQLDASCRTSNGSKVLSAESKDRSVKLERAVLEGIMGKVPEGSPLHIVFTTELQGSYWAKDTGNTFLAWRKDNNDKFAEQKKARAEAEAQKKSGTAQSTLKRKDCDKVKKVNEGMIYLNVERKGNVLSLAPVTGLPCATATISCVMIFLEQRIVADRPDLLGIVIDQNAAATPVEKKSKIDQTAGNKL